MSTVHFQEQIVTHRPYLYVLPDCLYQIVKFGNYCYWYQMWASDKTFLSHEEGTGITKRSTRGFIWREKWKWTACNTYWEVRTGREKNKIILRENMWTARIQSPVTVGLRSFSLDPTIVPDDFLIWVTTPGADSARWSAQLVVGIYQVSRPRVRYSCKNKSIFFSSWFQTNSSSVYSCHAPSMTMSFTACMAFILRDTGLWATKFRPCVCYHFNRFHSAQCPLARLLYRGANFCTHCTQQTMCTVLPDTKSTLAYYENDWHGPLLAIMP